METILKSSDQTYQSGDDKFIEPFFVNSPKFTLVVLCYYLIFVLYAGQRWMKNRPPYQLKFYLVSYNIFQVVSCICIMYSIQTTIPIWRIWKYPFCEENSKEEIFLKNLGVFAYWVRAMELTETVAFILRKKQSQVTKLHITHHVLSFALIWLLIKYSKGGVGAFSLYTNSLIHTIMYSYYLAAFAKNPILMRNLIKVKKFITGIQIIQFVLQITRLAVESMQNESGMMQQFIIYCHFGVTSLMLVMFVNFYISSYSIRDAPNQKDIKKCK